MVGGQCSVRMVCEGLGWCESRDTEVRRPVLLWPAFIVSSGVSQHKDLCVVSHEAHHSMMQLGRAMEDEVGGAWRVLQLRCTGDQSALDQAIEERLVETWAWY